MDLKNLENQLYPYPKNVASIDISNFFQIFGSASLPKGKIYEFFGGPGVGKTTLCLELIKKLQQQNSVMFVNADYCFDSSYGSFIGVDLELLYIINPDHFIQHYKSLLALVDVIFIDSIAALDLSKKGWAEFVSAVHLSECAVFLTNQIRKDIKRRKTVSAKYRTITPNIDIQIKLTNKTQIKKGNKIIGYNIKTKVTKNRLFPKLVSSNFFIPVRREDA